jgi:doublesex- and mab-3-related transcription factor 4/5
MAAQVALKRKQAAEDAIALGLRVVSGQSIDHLPQGPVWNFGADTNTADEDETDGDQNNNQLESRGCYFQQNFQFHYFWS